jgi:NRPS condensation-like uncharacterized protein
VKERVIPARFPAVANDRGFSALPESMAIHCMLSLSARIDEGRLARAVRLTLDAEPILGCRFVEHWFRPYWQRYDTLETMAFCEVRASSDSQADIRRFLEELPDPTLRVMLLRGDSDLLCLKLDHRVGDAKALQDYAYLLADIYNHLEEDPSYVPVSNVDGTRSLVQVGNRYGLREKWRIAGHTLKVIREVRRLGQWRVNVPPDGRFVFDYLSWHLDANQVNAILDYGYRHRVAISQVLLAAFYLAAYEVLPRSTDSLLPLSLAVDLRRHLRSTKRSAVCNLVGNCVIAIDPRSATSIDAVVQQIGDQMKSQQRYLGLPISFFPLEALPIIRHLVALVPYGLAQRSNRKRQQKPIPKDHVPGLILLTHLGELDHTRLAFGGAEVTEAFATAGFVRIPGILGLAVSGFRGSLTLYLGCAPTALLTRLCEQMMQVLPVRPEVSSKA